MDGQSVAPVSDSARKRGYETIAQLTRDDLRRIRLLRDNVIDLGIALDDLDRELLPRLAERARLDSLLRDAQGELSALIRKAA